ncbi:hypothetical protein B0I75DRAFT_154930 [Yarrowia lipolytica]|nr:hypothetical protein B0I74DRAFT_147308 [Yarrowia lipolytica]RDW49753.1 hypothetical protein B0I75DRAFT_154930 [Yarrowia lipolytica]
MRTPKASSSVQEPPQAHLRSSGNSYHNSQHFNGYFAVSQPHFIPRKLLRDEFGSKTLSSQSAFQWSHISAETSQRPSRLQKLRKKVTEGIYNAFHRNYKPPSTVVPETSLDASHQEPQGRTQSVFHGYRSYGD